MLHEFNLPGAANCSAGSPDGRLRAVVGDFSHTLILDLASHTPGRVLERLGGHTTPIIFAGAWSDDGIHIATGGEDGTVLVYDSRRWPQPLVSLTCEANVPRSLRFSPLGSGGSSSSSNGFGRTLAIAESEDIVSIVDAVSWSSKQTIDVFGSIAGIAYSESHGELFIANGDRTFGGMMRLEAWNGRRDAYQDHYEYVERGHDREHRGRLRGGGGGAEDVSNERKRGGTIQSRREKGKTSGGGEDRATRNSASNGRIGGGSAQGMPGASSAATTASVTRSRPTRTSAPPSSSLSGATSSTSSFDGKYHHDYHDDDDIDDQEYDDFSDDDDDADGDDRYADD